MLMLITHTTTCYTNSSLFAPPIWIWGKAFFLLFKGAERTKKIRSGTRSF